jgi:hypothetical protein
MPAVLEAISNSSTGPRVVTKRVASGGARLKDNWQGEAVLSEIRKGGWDYVVLNEQSSLGDVLIVNQQVQIAERNRRSYGTTGSCKHYKCEVKSSLRADRGILILPGHQNHRLRANFPYFFIEEVCILPKMSGQCRRSPTGGSLVPV